MKQSHPEPTFPPKGRARLYAYNFISWKKTEMLALGYPEHCNWPFYLIWPTGAANAS